MAFGSVFFDKVTLCNQFLHLTVISLLVFFSKLVVICLVIQFVPILLQCFEDLPSVVLACLYQLNRLKSQLFPFGAEVLLAKCIIRCLGFLWQRDMRLEATPLNALLDTADAMLIREEPSLAKLFHLSLLPLSVFLSQISEWLL